MIVITWKGVFLIKEGTSENNKERFPCFSAMFQIILHGFTCFNDLEVIIGQQIRFVSFFCSNEEMSTIRLFLLKCFIWYTRNVPWLGTCIVLYWSLCRYSIMPCVSKHDQTKNTKGYLIANIGFKDGCLYERICLIVNFKPTKTVCVFFD